MKNAGVFFEVVGLLMLLVGLFSDTTGGRDTHNIGLISDRETTTQVGGFLLVAGTVLHSGSFLEKIYGESSEELNDLSEANNEALFLVKNGTHVKQVKGEEELMKYLSGINEKGTVEVSFKENEDIANFEKYSPIFVKNLIKKSKNIQAA